ncbi:MAG: transcription antitermination factor NusB [Clostridia bacterium]|nr:transcription antitermination factor NusB [Clostridia bacterium]
MAREIAFSIVFESGFQKDVDMADIYETAKTVREFEDDPYIREVVLGVAERKDRLDDLIEKFSHGWKRNRISPVSMAIMEMAVYEMLYREDIPSAVSINEAIELVKTYDEENARAFVNGILNAVSKEIEASHEG